MLSAVGARDETTRGSSGTTVPDDARFGVEFAAEMLSEARPEEELAAEAEVVTASPKKRVPVCGVEGLLALVSTTSRMVMSSLAMP